MTTLVEMFFRADTRELDQAQAKLKDTGTAAEKASVKTDLLNGAMDKLKGTSGPIGEIASKFEDLAGTTSRTTAAISKFSGSLSTLGFVLASTAAYSGLLVGSLGALGIALGLSYQDRVNDLGDLGERFNLTATQVSALSRTIEAGGGSFNDYTSSLSRTTAALTKSGDEFKGVGAAFATLGVNTTDANGKLRDSASVAADVVRAYEDGEQTTAKLAAAQLILGKNFLDVAKSIKDAEKGYAEAMRLYELGIGITNEGVAATGEAADANRTLGLIMESVGSELVASVVPAFTSLVRWLNKSYEEGGLVYGAFQLIRAGTDFVVIGIKSLISFFIALDNIVTGLVKTFTNLGKAISSALKGSFDESLANMKNIVTDWKSTLIAGNTEIAKLFEGPLFTAGTTGTIAAPKRGPSPAGGGVANDVAAKAAKAEDERKKHIDEQIKLLERLASLYKDQYTTSLELLGVDTQRLKLEGELIEVTNAISGLTVEQKNERVQAVLAQYDLNKAKKDELDIQKKITEEQKRSTELVDAALSKSNAALLKIQGDFAGRFQSKSDREADAKRRGVTDPLNAELLKNQGVLSSSDSSSEQREAAERQIANINRLLAVQTEAVNKTLAEQQRLENSVQDGLLIGVRDYLDTLPTLSAGISNVVVSAGQTMEDTLFAAFTGGEFSMKSFFRSLLAQLLQLTIRLMIIKPLMDAVMGYFGAPAGGASASTVASFGPTTSSLGSGLTGINYLAKGGVINSPTYLGGGNIGGEAGPEGVLPLRRTASGDLGVMVAASGKSSSPQINNITVNVQGGNTNEDTGNVVSKKILDVMKGIARQEIMTQSRVGGSLNPV